MKLVDRLLPIFFPGLIIGIFVVQVAPLLLEATEQYYLRRRLDADINGFYTAVKAAHDTALRERQRIRVEVSPEGWLIYRDDGQAWQRDGQDIIVSTGKWNEDIKFGSTIPGNKIYFDQQGHCHINQDTACIEYSDSEEPNGLKQPSILAFTSNAKRIYTLSFDKNGKPDFGYDDF